MTKDEIICMAREAGLVNWEATAYANELERFAALVASAERECILDICKEGLWDVEGIRYHLDNQDKGQA